jgi:hypothetical protein
MYNIPRNGRSRNVSQFFSDDADLRSHYLYGLIFIFSFLIIFAAVWFLTIIILRILGPRVGCASGRPITIPAEPISNNNDKSIASDTSEEYIVMESDQKRVNRTRIIFLFAVLSTLVSCGFMGFFLFMFQASSEDIYESVSSLRDSFAAVSDNYDTLFFASATFDIAKNLLVEDLSTFCQTSNGTVDGQDPTLIVESLKDSLTNLNATTPDSKWESLKLISYEFSKIFDDIEKKLSYFEGSVPLWLIVSISIYGIIIVLTVYFLICAWKAGHRGYEFVGDTRNSCKDRLTLNVASPLYILIIIGMWVLASFLLASSAAVSDICVDEVTNGDTLLNIIENFAGNQTSIFYQITDNYIHVSVWIGIMTYRLLFFKLMTHIFCSSLIICSFKDCANGYMPELDFANDCVVQMDVVKSRMADFLDLDVTQLDVACTGDAHTIVSKVQSARVGLQLLYDAFDAVYPSCTKIASVLQPAIYENMCDDFIQNIVRLFAATLPLAVFGTIIITLRTALFRPRIYLKNDQKMNEDESYYDDNYY